MIRASCYLRLNTAEDLAAILADKMRQFVILSDALVFALLDRLIDFEWSEETKFDIKDLMLSQEKDENFSPGTRAIFDIFRKCEMFTNKGVGAYFILDNMGMNDIKIAESIYSYPISELEKFAKTYFPLMVQELLYDHSLTNSKAGVSFRSLLYSNQDELVGYICHSIIRLLNFRGISGGENHESDEYSEKQGQIKEEKDLKINNRTGDDIVNHWKKFDLQNTEHVIMCYDPNDAYHVSILGEIKQDFYITYKEMVEVIINKEAIHGTLSKLNLIFTRSIQATDSSLEDYNDESDIREIKKVPTIQTVKNIYSKEISLLSPHTTEPGVVAGIIYSLDNTLDKNKNTNYVSHWKPELKNSVLERLRPDQRALFGPGYGCLPLMPSVILGPSGTHKTTYVDNIPFHIFGSKQLFLINPLCKEVITPLKSSEVFIYKLIVTESPEPVMIGDLDLEPMLKEHKNYQSTALPYSKLGYYLCVMQYLVAIQQSYKVAIILFDSASDNLFGQFAAQELQKISQLREGGVNPAARTDFHMLFVPIESFNRKMNKYGRFVSSVLIVNTDNNKATASSFALINGISPITMTNIDENQTVLDSNYRQLIIENKVRVRRNSTFKDGFFNFNDFVKVRIHDNDNKSDLIE